MTKPIKVISCAAPVKFVDLGNGNWYYNYDINSSTIETKDIEGNLITETRWSFIQIKFTSKPEYKKCVEAVIRQYITPSEEFDLINSANRILISRDDNKKIPQEYIEYLALLDEIKTKIKADFNI